MAAQAKQREPARPDGIEPRHVAEGASHGPSVLSFIVLGGVLAWGVSGFAGGRDVDVTQTGPAATLRVHAPSVIRTGEIFESRIEVRAHRPIDKLVVAVTPALWRNMTLNSMTPTPGDETFGDDLFRFSYGKVEAGARFEVKLDLQINPALHGENAGRVAIYDGEQRLADVGVATRVLP